MVLGNREDFEFDAQRRVRAYVLSRYGDDTYSTVFAADTRSLFSLESSTLPVEVSPFGSAIPDIFSLIGMALSPGYIADFVFDEIKSWVDGKHGRTVKLATGELQIEIDCNVTAAEIDRGFEQFQRLRNETEGGGVIQVIEI